MTSATMVYRHNFVMEETNLFPKHLSTTPLFPINDVYPCLQGEGHHTGVPMILVRLHGCPVGCVFCDTRETWLYQMDNKRETIAEVLGANPLFTYQSAVDIGVYVQLLARSLGGHDGPGWVLLTGGEPAMQSLADLVASFHIRGFKVALETSGTALGHINAGVDWVCVSPKIDNPGKRPIYPLAIEKADELKFVIGRESDIERARKFAQEYTLKEGVEICLQPMSQNEKATKSCIEWCQKLGWRLSVQTHKYLNLP